MDVKRESRLRLKFIESVLWNDWDPVGVNDAVNAVDEYDSYAPDLVALSYKEGEFTEQNITKYLLWVETERMGMSGNEENARKVAKKLVEAFEMIY